MLSNEDYKKWLESLKVGDRVCYRTGSISFRSYKIAAIEKITPTRRFVVDGIKFDNSGREMGEVGTWTPRKELEPVTKEVEDATLREQILNKISRFNFDELDIVKLKVINDIISK
jgi:hypothetical protein